MLKWVSRGAQGTTWCLITPLYCLRVTSASCIWNTRTLLFCSCVELCLEVVTKCSGCNFTCNLWFGSIYLIKKERKCYLVLQLWKHENQDWIQFHVSNACCDNSALVGINTFLRRFSLFRKPKSRKSRLENLRNKRQRVLLKITNNNNKKKSFLPRLLCLNRERGSNVCVTVSVWGSELSPGPASRRNTVPKAI